MGSTGRVCRDGEGRASSARKQRKQDKDPRCCHRNNREMLSPKQQRDDTFEKVAETHTSNCDKQPNRQTGTRESIGVHEARCHKRSRRMSSFHAKSAGARSGWLRSLALPQQRGEHQGAEAVVLVVHDVKGQEGSRASVSPRLGGASAGPRGQVEIHT